MQHQIRHPNRFCGASVAILAGLFLAAVNPARASLINGDFETGDFTGWTLFTTASGSLGLAQGVTLFDTNNDSTATLSATFNVGASNPLPPGPWGGGIFQTITTGAGPLAISLDIASQATGLSNGSGGLFELLFNGAVVDSFDFGGIAGGATEFGSLGANLNVAAGDHEVRIRMTRPFTTSINTPRQYIDNVTTSGPAAVPEPSTALLLGGSLLLGFFANRRSTRQRVRSSQAE